jgi:transposase InsO family protein
MTSASAPRQALVATGPKSLYVKGSLEGQSVRFLVDTGAEISGISYAMLARLPEVIRAAFQDQAYTVTTVSGERVSSKGPVMCNIMVGGRVVTDAVIAMQMEPDAILSLPTLAALGGQVTVAGVELLPVNPSIRNITGSRVLKVRADGPNIIPARSEKVIPCRIQGNRDAQTLVIEGAEGTEVGSFQIAHSITEGKDGRTQVRLLNPTDTDIKVKPGQYIANAAVGQVLTEVDTSALSENVNQEEVPTHLKELFDQTCDREKLNDEMRAKLKALLAKYGTLFAKNNLDLGRTSIVEHDIDTGDSPPIRQPPRRPPIAQQAEIDREIESMLKARVIEPGQSPWASPVVLVRKRDGSVRFCVDYRRLNSVTRFDAYPLPRIDETFESLSGARFFSTLDLISGYWQVGLTEQARLKTAFTTRGGLYLWNVLPFGLSNAPSTFERLMETVLHGLQWESCLVYLDDVVVFASSESEMLTRLDTVFDRLKNAGLKLKPRKCRLFARETEYLGHTISEAGVAASSEKTRAILEWPTPRCVTDLRSFLGTASYYRRFVRGFATIASPLHRLTESQAQWAWTAEHEDAFQQLKAVLADTPVLRFPVADAPYILDTDASLTGIGAVLSQVVDGQERVLGYASRTLSKQERNYCVTRREMLAVVHFTKHFRPYLYGRRFTVRTDHSSLQWLRNFKEPEGQLARWLEVLQEYDYIIVHRPGKQHGNADGLSRQQCQQCGREHDDPRPKRTLQSVRVVSIKPRWTASEFQAAQKADADLAQFLRSFESRVKPSSTEESAWSAVARHYLRDWDRFSLIDGVLARQWFDSAGQPTSYQWVVPRQFVTDILEQAHAAHTSGHFSDKRTLARAKEAFYWQGMSRDTRDFCRACRVCGARRPKPTAPHHLYQRQVTTEPLQKVAVDILGPLDPPTARGNRYILVIVDYFTKWLEALPMPDQRAETCAEKFVSEFVSRFGICDQLHSDQGRQFESALMQQVCKLLGINKSRTTPLHPQSDGQTERANRTLLDVVAKIAIDEPRQWDLVLPYMKMAYNSSIHSVTGETPNRLMLGRELRAPVTLMAPPLPNQEADVDWVERQKTLIRETFAKVAERTQASHRAEVPRLYKRQKGYAFKTGDKVWLYNPKSRRGVTPKLDANRWSGPWVVTRCISAVVYALKKAGTNKTTVVNVDRMSPWIELDSSQFPPIEHAIEGEEGEATAIDHVDHQGDLDRDNSDTERRNDAGFLPDMGYSGQESEDNGTVNQEEDVLLEPAVTPLQCLDNRLTTRAQRARRVPRRWTNYYMNSFV